MAWGWVARLFASTKSVEDITGTGKMIAEGLAQGADYLRFSEQERADYNLKGANVMLAFWDKVREENSLQSQARRELALLTLKSFFAMLFLAILCRVISTFLAPFMDVSKFIIEIALSGIVGGLVISIGAIYFGPHQLSKIVDFRKKD